MDHTFAQLLDLRIKKQSRERFDLLGIHPALPSRLEVHDACSDILLLALAGLALAVYVPDGLRQGLENIGTFPGKDIVYMVARGEVRLPSLESLCNAQETNDVAVISVEELTSEGQSITMFLSWDSEK